MELTSDQREEMIAIREVMQQTGKPTFQSNLNIPDLQQMIDAGLLEIGPHPEFSDDFKAISLTQAGLFAVAGQHLQE